MNTARNQQTEPGLSDEQILKWNKRLTRLIEENRRKEQQRKEQQRKEQQRNLSSTASMAGSLAGAASSTEAKADSKPSSVSTEAKADSKSSALPTEADREVTGIFLSNEEFLRSPRGMAFLLGNEEHLKQYYPKKWENIKNHLMEYYPMDWDHAKKETQQSNLNRIR